MTTVSNAPRHHSPTRLLACLAAAVPLALFAAGTQAQVVISQLYGGNGNTYASDYVELLNTSTAAVNITGWTVQYASASGTGTFAGNGVATLSGTLQAGQYYLVKLATSTAGTALPTADATGSLNLSGSAGKVILTTSSTGLACNGYSTVCTSDQLSKIVDLVGYGSTANFFEGTAAPAPSTTTALFRVASGCTDTGNNTADFITGVPAPRNSSTATINCGVTPAPTPAPAPAPSKVSIPAIQGSGATSPLAGQTVQTEGVVTRVSNNGFYMQALVGDGNADTSDGILVFTSTAPTVVAGQLVQVTGTVTEYSTGGGYVTELSSPSTISVLGTGYTITPTPITLPVTGGLERYEGMLVTLSGPLTVNQNYYQARYGQLTLSAGGRLETPTNKYRPGSQAQTLTTDNAARRIVLEDGSSLQNVNPTPFTGPTGSLRGGDVIGTITGVIDYGPSTSTASGPGDYRIVPLSISSLSYTTSNPRDSVAPALTGNVRLASFNVLNFFTTFTNGNTASGLTGQGCTEGSSNSSSNCRGADSLAEFTRQRAKIVEALAAINADAVGLMEIQNNTVAAQNLVDALNAKVGAGTYAVVPDGANGSGTDAIKVAIIYKPARLSRYGASVSDASAINNRPPLAQTFAAVNGEKFTFVVNHLKSKSSCPSSGVDADQGDGQGCWNNTRVQQATQLRSFVAQLQTSSGSNDVMLVGDFNAYGQEDPVYNLTSSGYVDQAGRFSSFAYSYVYDGAAGRLDQAISSATLSSKVANTQHWHINADESIAQDYNLENKQPACTTCATDPYTVSAFRASDHDPVIVDLNLYNKTLTAAAGSSTAVVGTAGDDLIISGAGRRSLTGGAGSDQFAFSADFAGGATITDFQPGVDVINLRAVLQGLRITASSPLSQGYVKCSASGSDALISIDPDAAGSAASRPMVLLKGVSCNALSASSYIL
jgi:predicted extracellular nuclease